MEKQSAPSLPKPLLWLDNVTPILAVLATAGILLALTPLGRGIQVVNHILQGALAIDFMLRLITHPLGRYFRHGAGFLHGASALPGLLLPFFAIPGVDRLVDILSLLPLFRLASYLGILSLWRGRSEESTWVRRRVRSAGVLLVAAGIASVFICHYLVRSQHFDRVRQSLDLQEKLTGSFSLAVQLLPPADLIAWQQGPIYTRPLDDMLTAREYRLLQSRPVFQLVRLDDQRSVIIHDHGFEQSQRTTALALLALTLILLMTLALWTGGRLQADQERLRLLEDSLASGDGLLLGEATRWGNREPAPARDEIDALMATAEHTLAQPPRPDPEAPPIPPPSSSTLEGTLSQFREKLLEDLKNSSQDTAISAVRISAKSVVDYLRKHGYGS